MAAHQLQDARLAAAVGAGEDDAGEVGLGRLALDADQVIHQLGGEGVVADGVLLRVLDGRVVFKPRTETVLVAPDGLPLVEAAPLLHLGPTAQGMGGRWVILPSSACDEGLIQAADDGPQHERHERQLGKPRFQVMK
ncbi:MAG: hypothetical protein ACPGUV_11740 [Polyangiales bacterium]